MNSITKVVEWSFTVTCIAKVVTHGDSCTVTSVTALSESGEPVKLDLRYVDVASEEKAMAADDTDWQSVEEDE